MKILPTTFPVALAIGLILSGTASAQLKADTTVRITFRGVPAEEQSKMDGDYLISDAGTIRLPLVNEPMKARGLTADQFARNAEKAYRDAGVYAKPAIKVGVSYGGCGPGTQIAVGGQVRRPGHVQFVKRMTLVQAIRAVGDRNESGSPNITLFRKGKAIHLDFRKAEHKNLILEPDDTIEVMGIVEGDRG